MRSGDGSRPDEDLALQFYDVDPADRPPPECIVRIRGVVGLCDLLEDRLNSLGDELDLKARFADLDEMIRQTEPDLVAIPTAPALHAPLALRVLEHGRQHRGRKADGDGSHRGGGKSARDRH